MLSLIPAGLLQHSGYLAATAAESPFTDEASTRQQNVTNIKVALSLMLKTIQSLYQVKF
ncbi:hypothetical protein SAMN04488540_111100 [Ferrimonas sediminum]|uniref:Uncharacterized protein n=1 Tax=Ferrimonas sediminum TaxID=718193 RepID=A0A1G8VMD7_9GAMM|nr:hypothetical protein [Ferrimonas sediminum]SDJ67211.1 hypothetical protein SAMN04488540_111100 [Ferrimonas sediminum]